MHFGVRRPLLALLLDINVSVCFLQIQEDEAYKHSP